MRVWLGWSGSLRRNKASSLSWRFPDDSEPVRYESHGGGYVWDRPLANVRPILRSVFEAKRGASLRSSFI